MPYFLESVNQLIEAGYGSHMVQSFPLLVRCCLL